MIIHKGRHEEYESVFIELLFALAVAPEQIPQPQRAPATEQTAEIVAPAVLRLETTSEQAEDLWNALLVRM